MKTHDQGREGEGRDGGEGEAALCPSGCLLAGAGVRGRGLGGLFQSRVERQAELG